MNTEFFDDAINVTCAMDAQGHTNLQSFIWGSQQYTIVTVGRQWDEDDGRHVMAEAVDGTRFELLLHRQDLIWRVKKVWRAQILA